MWPQIKKTVKEFISEESGAISKKAMIHLGILSSLAVISSGQALATEDTGWYRLVIKPSNFQCVGPNMIGQTTHYFAVGVWCNEPDSYDECEVAVVTPPASGEFFDSADFESCPATGECPSLTFTYDSSYCSDSAWAARGMPWVDVVDCSMASESESFKAEISVDDVYMHQNSLGFGSDGSELVAQHTHSITEGNEDCDYVVDIAGIDLSDGDSTGKEVYIRYDAHFKNSGEKITEQEIKYFDMG
jgi:hypothetical protein